MKRMLTVLVVLLLTAPVLAVPTISCVFDCNTHIATVSYSGVDSNNLIVALGLDITADGASITNVGGWNPSVDDYWVYPGSISIADGNVVGYGTPVAAANSPGFNASGTTVEMGALWNVGKGDTPPATSGDLFTVTVDDDCTLYVTGNTTRGGVVLEDGSIVPVDSNCYCEGGPPPECMMATAPEYTYWVGDTEGRIWNKPDCWCYKKQCSGDATGSKVGDFFVNTADVAILRDALYKDNNDAAMAAGICADFTHSPVGDFHVNTADVSVIRTYLYVNPIPDCDGTYINYWLTP